jgi:cytochrome c peroxidase
MAHIKQGRTGLNRLAIGLAVTLIGVNLWQQALAQVVDPLDPIEVVNPLDPIDPLPVPQTLKGVSIPTPSNIDQFVQSRSAAVALGKALFWDMQLGSDGKTACATCHFHAGADNRDKNQRVSTPNSTFAIGDFPFHQLSDVNDRKSTVVRSLNDKAGSQGVFLEEFIKVCLRSNGGTLPTPMLNQLSTDPYADLFTTCAKDRRTALPDTQFNVGGVDTRRITGRNTPTVINAVFNFRNFWDGRAQYTFNGVNPFGQRDANARVYRNSSLGMEAVQISLDNASLASQASGPPLSGVEMSANGRNFADLGKKLIYLAPLAKQEVAANDSVLGPLRARSGTGLKASNYESMIRAAFRPEWWNGAQLVQFNADGSKSLVPLVNKPAVNQYSHMQQNFALFFGLALQMYESTLVSDDAPFDRHLTGESKAMSQQQLEGMGLFFGKAKCANCHTGPEFTSATVRRTLDQPLERMLMGNGEVAVYDNGFYNIGVRPTDDDIGNGGNDPFGQPLALSSIAKLGSSEFRRLIGISANTEVAADERIAVNGAFKVPSLRNIELTAPYFHNGSAATLREVVEFYNRGGNFHEANQPDLDADIETLGLSEDEKTALVQFLHTLTDDRVRFNAAPFDHPELRLPNGHVGDTAQVVGSANGTAMDNMVALPATGAKGWFNNRILTPANFLNVANSGSPWVNLMTRNSGKCLQSTTTGIPSAVIAATACTSGARQRYRVVSALNGTFHLSDIDDGSFEAATANAGVAKTRFSLDKAQQHWYLVDLGNGYHQIRSRATDLCIAVDTSTQRAKQAACSSASEAQQFALNRVN